MISNRPMIPMLTHVDNLGDINLDMTSQEQSLETIASNTGATNTHLDFIENGILTMISTTDATIEENTRAIRSNTSKTDTTTSSLYSSVGTTADAATETTVIGLLKSIVNKLS